MPKNDIDAIAARVRLKLFNALDEWTLEQDVEPISPKVRLKLFNALDEWTPENDVESIGDDANYLHPSTNNDLIDEQPDILDQDWLNDERAAETFGDGFEEFTVDNQASEESEDDFDIVEFDTDAQQTLWEIEPEAESQSLLRARMKAAAITNLLEFRSISARDDAILYLTEHFIQMPHSATFRAIQRVSEGIDLETLKAMIELRQIWMRRTDWWRLGLYPPRRSLAFTWDIVRLVCLVRKDYPPELMIDEEWLKQWLQLPNNDPTYTSFSQYIEEKMLSSDVELLDEGLTFWEQSDGYAEIGDHFNWYRQGSHYDNTIRDNFRIITPYDDRIGVIAIKNFNWEVSFNYWMDKYNQKTIKWLLCTWIYWTDKYKNLKEKDDNYAE